MSEHKRAHLHVSQNIGEKIADAVASGMGSWRFIIIQTMLVGLWIGTNLLFVIFRFDPYPFILLNLLFSTQAAYAAPVIMMSQNRSAARDRKRDDIEAQEVDEVHMVQQEVLALQHTQLEILRQQSAILERLDMQPAPLPPKAATRPNLRAVKKAE